MVARAMFRPPPAGLGGRGCAWRASQLARCRAHSTGFSEIKDSPKAAALVIGNELLNGQIADVNFPWLSKMLYNRGVDCVRCEFVPDIQDEIVESLLKLKSKVGENGVIFTSGGIGPTHDDITYESIAKAFGTTAELHDETVELMKVHYGSQGKEVNEARLRMARLPKGCEVLTTPGLWVPLAVIENVYILPGIPRLFRAMVDAHKDRFRGPASYSQIVFTKSGEGDIAATLNGIVERYPTVEIGSYPSDITTNPDYLTKLVLHSRDEAAVTDASKEMMDSIPACWQ